MLPVFSKEFETIVFNQLYDYFQKYELLYTGQYGFRLGHSTEFATIDLMARIIQAMDHGQLPICIVLDLSKVFDTLDHQILLNKWNYYRVKDMSSKLFVSYLSKRKQYVEFDGVNSNILQITTGVPQGLSWDPCYF